MYQTSLLDTGRYPGVSSLSIRRVSESFRHRARLYLHCGLTTRVFDHSILCFIVRISETARTNANIS